MSNFKFHFTYVCTNNGSLKLKVHVATVVEIYLEMWDKEFLRQRNPPQHPVAQIRVNLSDGTDQMWPAYRDKKPVSVVAGRNDPVLRTVTMPAIKDFTMTYEALNPEIFFSEGDTITGTVTLTLTKDTKVKSLFVKAKGDACVCWVKTDGEGAQMHRATKRYFKVKEYLVPEAVKGKLN